MTFCEIKNRENNKVCKKNLMINGSTPSPQAFSPLGPKKQGEGGAREGDGGGGGFSFVTVQKIFPWRIRRPKKKSGGIQIEGGSTGKLTPRSLMWRVTLRVLVAVT